MSCQGVATQDFNTTIRYLFDVRLIRLILLREYQTKLMSDLVKPGREMKQFAEGDAYLFLQVSLVMNMRDDQLSLGRNVAIETGGKLSVKWDIDSVTSHCSYQIDS